MNELNKNLLIYSQKNTMYYRRTLNTKTRANYLNLANYDLEEWEIFHSPMFTNFMYTKTKLPIQGWKIHISTNINNAGVILDIVSDILIDKNISFKYISNPSLLLMTSEKAFPSTQFGKFITIYPKNRSEFLSIIDILHIKLRKYTGSYILGDHPYKDSKVIYYRYGGFDPIKILDDNENYYYFIRDSSNNFFIDERTPIYKVPDGVEPIFEAVDNNEKASTGLDSYYLEYAIRQTNAGGIYYGVAKKNRKKIVIKEARPFTMKSDSKTQWDAISYKKREKNVFQKFDFTPKVIESFYIENNYYLVVEFLEGDSLKSIVSSSPLYKGNTPEKEIKNYLNKILKISEKIYTIIQSFHKESLILNDISPDNFLIDSNRKTVKLIDAESVTEITESLNENPLKTNGFYLDYPKGSFKGDIEALILLIFYCISGKNAEIQANSEIVHIELSSLSTKFPIEVNKIVGFINNLVEQNNLEGEAYKKIELSILNKPVVSKFNWENFNKITNKLESFIKNQLENQDNFKENSLPVTPYFTNDLGFSYGLSGIIYFSIKTGTITKEEIYGLTEQLIDIYEHTVISDSLTGGKAGIILSLLPLVNRNKKIDSFIKKLAEELYTTVAIKYPLKNKISLFHGLPGMLLVLLKYYSKKKNDIMISKIKKLADNLFNEINSKNIETDYIGLSNGITGTALALIHFYKYFDENKYLKLSEKLLLCEMRNCFSKGELVFPEKKEDLINYPYLTVGASGILKVVIIFLEHKKNKKLEKFAHQIVREIDTDSTIYYGYYRGMAGIIDTLIDYNQLFPSENNKEKIKSKINYLLDRKIDISSSEVTFMADQLHKTSLDYGSGVLGILTTFKKYKFNSEYNPLFVFDVGNEVNEL